MPSSAKGNSAFQGGEDVIFLGTISTFEKAQDFSIGNINDIFGSDQLLSPGL